MTRTELGNIMITTYGGQACQSGYRTDDPATIGILALEFGDINEDGTLN